ncbi:MAG: ferritin family protein [Desulforhopalus sp.]
MSLLGATKGTELEPQVEQLLNLEKDGSALYLALAYVARQQGLSKLAEGLEHIAADEARHAGLYAIMNGKVTEDLLPILTNIAEQESKAESVLAPIVERCRELELREVAEEIDKAAKEEVRHGKMIHGLIEKYL